MPVLKRDDADIAYEVQGKGPALLLIAGTAWEGVFWKPWQVPDLARDHTVITFDLRGTGKTVLRGKDYSTDALAADAAALIAHVGAGPATVVGHSMGGRIAQLVALDHRQHVSKLILASTGASFKVKGGISPAMCLAIIRQGYESYVREHSIGIGFSKAFVAARPERVKQFIDLMMATLPPIEVYFEHVVSRQMHDTSLRLKDISVPTLVLVGGDETHGNSDTTHVASSEALAKRIPGATFFVLPGQGHFYPFSDPDTTSRLIRTFAATGAI